MIFKFLCKKKKSNYQYEKLNAWLECLFYIKDHQSYNNKVHGW